VAEGSAFQKSSSENERKTLSSSASVAVGSAEDLKYLPLEKGWGRLVVQGGYGRDQNLTSEAPMALHLDLQGHFPGFQFFRFPALTREA
jgi:hypothetical protein